MSKIGMILLTIILILSLTGCTKVNDNSGTNTNGITDTTSGATKQF